MARENITVLMDLLKRLEHDRQQLESPVDSNTLLLCRYELETSWQQVSEDHRSSLRNDRIENCLDLMTDSQWLKAKDMSSLALGDYQDIRTMSFECPKIFEVRYWNELTNQQKENKLKECVSTPRCTKTTRNSTGQYNDKSFTKPKASNGQYVTKVNVITEGWTSMTRNDARQDLSSQVPRTSGIAVSSLKVNDQKQQADQSHFTDRSEVKPASTTTKLDNKIPKDRTIINATENTPRSMMVEPVPVKSEQRSAAETIQSSRKTGLHGSSDQHEIIEQFTQVYHQYYKPLFDSIIRQQKFTGDLISKELLEIVKIIADLCKSFAQEQIHNMQTCVNKVTGDGTLTTQVKDDVDEFCFFEFRRLNAELSLDILYQRCLETIKSNNNIQTIYSSRETERAFKDFLFVCVEVIWYMTVQDRPVVLEYDAATRQDALLLFQGYTSTKQRLDHVIWPAVRSFKDGPVLDMGVALFTYERCTGKRGFSISPW